MSRIWSLLVGLWVSTLASVALAHHVPGHGASEGVRNLNSLGGGAGAAGTRLMLLQELSPSSTSLNPGLTSVTSFLVEYAPHPWLSFSVAAPLLLVREDLSSQTKVGYGDTRVGFRITPHADKLIHRVLTVGANASFPTRTIRFEADPGRIWSVSPFVLFTRTYERVFWQVSGVGTLESRPAGLALDLSPSTQVGIRIRDLVIPAVGVLADIRVATFCARAQGGYDYCHDGRVTEVDRPVGAVRVVQSSTLSFNLGRFLLTGGLQLPLNTRRDFDYGVTFSVQARF